MAALPTMPRRFSSEFHVGQEGLKCLSSTPSHSSRKSFSAFPANDDSVRTKAKRRISFSGEAHHGKKAEYLQTRTEEYYMFGGSIKSYSSRANSWSTSCRDDLYPICYAASESDPIEEHQKSLETYLEKLHGQAKEGLSDDGNDISELRFRSSQVEAREGLRSLEKYITILKEDSKPEEYLPSTSSRNTAAVTEDSAYGYLKAAKQKRSSVYARNSESSPLYDEKESANLYLISTLLSINIAVFIFEIASPIKSSDYNLCSLPLLYGAKVNDLIMAGEWWRLLTPTFLHSGLLHIALSSWVLLLFGPQVCQGYGSFTFLLIYLLGGISGNFTSFLHTSEPTVGGSGPIFAVIGSWLIYQLQNKTVSEKENFDSLFQKALLATSFSFVLGSFGAIDNWANLGAAVSGIIYGFLTCPAVQVDDAPATASGDRVKEEITLSRRPAKPCKSLIIFSLIVSVLSYLIFFAESPLNTLELEELVQIVE